MDKARTLAGTVSAGGPLAGMVAAFNAAQGTFTVLERLAKVAKPLPADAQPE